MADAWDLKSLGAQAPCGFESRRRHSGPKIQVMTISQALDLAVERHQSGRLADAEALYRQILAVQPGHSDALHLLGVIAHQTGRHDLALEWIRRAIVLDPKNPFAYSNLGEVCRTIGALDDAIANFRCAVKLK